MFDELPAGSRYKNGNWVVKENAVIEDLSIPVDRRTITMVRQIVNDIHLSIQLETEFPSNHEDRKMAISVLKVLIKDTFGVRRIIQEFYANDVSGKALVDSKSAFCWRQKRTVLTQEMLHALLNCYWTFLDIGWLFMQTRWYLQYNT